MTTNFSILVELTEVALYLLYVYTAAPRRAHPIHQPNLEPGYAYRHAWLF